MPGAQYTRTYLALHVVSHRGNPCTAHTTCPTHQLIRPDEALQYVSLIKTPIIRGSALKRVFHTLPQPNTTYQKQHGSTSVDILFYVIMYKSM